MFGRTNQKVNVLDFILTQTGTYQEQAIRPFTTTIGPEHVAALEQSTMGGQNVGVAAVQSVASSVIRPNATVEGASSIIEGWNSRRFRFLMVVEEQHPFATNDRTRRVYFGYTDHCDASVNHLDPNMRIYFNSETVIQDAVRTGPNGPIVETMVLSSNQIVSPVNNAGRIKSSYYATPSTYLLRPEDTFLHGGATHVADNLRASGILNGDISHHIDTRSLVGEGGDYKYSQRRHTIPSRYLSESLKGFKHAVKEASLDRDFDHGMDRELMFNEASSYVASPDITANTFFAILRDQAGFMEKGFITLSELNAIFPETSERYDVTKYALDDGRGIRRVSFVEDSEHWSGSDNITLAACTLGQVIPAVMMDNFIRSISFAATNGHGLGQFAIEFHPHMLRSVVDGLQMAPYLQEFERRLIFDALVPLTYNNQVGFQVSMACDLAGESVIDIAMDGEPIRRYVVPTFTDSLFTPIITQSQDRQSTMASDLMFLIENAMPFKNNVNTHAAAAPAVNQNNHAQPAQGTSYEYSGLL